MLLGVRGELGVQPGCPSLHGAKSPNTSKLTNHSLWTTALPFLVSLTSQPLLSLCDLANKFTV